MTSFLQRARSPGWGCSTGSTSHGFVGPLDDILWNNSHNSNAGWGLNLSMRSSTKFNESNSWVASREGLYDTGLHTTRRWRATPQSFVLACGRVDCNAGSQSPLQGLVSTWSLKSSGLNGSKDNGLYMSCTWRVGWFGKIATLFQIDTRTPPLKKKKATKHNKTKQLVTKRCQLEPWQILWNLRTRLRSKPLASLAFKWSMCSVGQVRLRKCSEGPVLLYIHISPCGSIQWCERIEKYWKSHKDCSILSLFWVYSEYVSPKVPHYPH